MSELDKLRNFMTENGLAVEALVILAQTLLVESKISSF